jgi:hypothetical protein
MSSAQVTAMSSLRFGMELELLVQPKRAMLNSLLTKGFDLDRGHLSNVFGGKMEENRRLIRLALASVITDNSAINMLNYDDEFFEDKIKRHRAKGYSCWGVESDPSIDQQTSENQSYCDDTLPS